MGDGRLSEGIDKRVDGCGGLDYESKRGLCVFPARAAQAPPPNSTPLPPLRDQGIIGPIHKGNVFQTKPRFRWYNEIKVLCG